MPPIRVLVANEPRAYREAIAAGLRELRPAFDVVETDPAGLDAAVVRLAPAFVVCSEVTEVVETRSPAWVLLYPEGTRLAVASVAGEHATTGELDLAGLLALLDRAAA